MACYSPLKGFRDRETNGIVFRANGSSDAEMEVACGQCLGCRLDRSRMWSMRIVHEAAMCRDDAGSCFVTLTYRNRNQCTRKQLRKGHHVPDDWGLSRPKRIDGKQVEKSHFQEFMKRLRRARPKTNLKYYHCGEYGAICRHGLDLEEVGCPLCNTGRPHYHAILFNVSFPDMMPIAKEGDIVLYESEELRKIWPYGFSTVGQVTIQSAAYVARYTLKKITGDLAEEHYSNVNEYGEIVQVSPEYASMSNGIGKSWYEKYKTDVFPSDQVPVPGKGVLRKAPRYYDEILKEEDPEAYEELKTMREDYALENSENLTTQRLVDQFKVRQAATKSLKRDIN